MDAVRELAHVSVHDLYATCPDFHLGWAFTMDGSASQPTDRKAVVAVTTGVLADHYTPEGANQATIETVLSNRHATLRPCQFDIQPVAKLHGTAFGLSGEDLATAAKQYNELLASFAA
ncbi:NAD(P)H-dependent oxidoreductase [Streptomyces sp. NBC_01261]|uniref:NAD(P)H-dependent oxidoreductase n=1 Tax=Streptomyces sp. NBC_01261 TaxID=2903802 RepID=UPI002E31C1D7|nr:NAD(P)H-dependent oxidoreductase [Streptomyces sp. NBC_01261]